ncbi:CHAT domain-containing protein [Micrococcus luteus]|uniref:CHAT domain-containing protein n=1 Tax=Micrococcus luteus TaxID=1270 RepID=UPI001CA6EEBA|nr:CHAT domain-containing protein [Micrococcus luteus]QZY84651.1 CHAT domain-containing protein [Micrococcus luteus]
MSANQYRSELERKRKQRIDAEKKAASYRVKESSKRAQAAQARQSAGRVKSEATVRSKIREAERREGEAVTAGKEAARWQGKAADYAKAEAGLQEKLARAERSEATVAEKRRQRDLQQAERRAAAEKAAFDLRVSHAETAVSDVLRQLPAPKPEKLRVLMLGASSEGDLRVGREQKRIRAAVESALHRDQIELDARAAATTHDLLDGLSRFRPHVVHFSGHSNEDLILFEDERDEPHEGVVVNARVFAKAIQATDDPPLLVLLNSCKSASQIDALVEQVVPFAIGMADEIGDADAINYAAQFYASVANGQSIQSAHLAGKVRLELDGLEGSELPTLAWADDVDPATTMLVKPDDPSLRR